MAVLRARRWAKRAEYLRAGGIVDDALACCKRSLDIHDRLHEAHECLAAILMPGEDYMTVLGRFHGSLRPRTYVEIGVRWGNSLAMARTGTRAIGIDPRPRIEVDLVSRPKLFPMPSDDFFESFDLLKELDDPRLALAFIDGLHVFEQVLRDFIHLERYADDKTVVLIHDCLPIARLAASREPLTQFWSGDVWKIVPCLKKYRPDLKIGIIPARPSGLGLVTNLDPKSTVLIDRLAEITAEYQGRQLHYDYGQLDRNSIFQAMPDVVANDWKTIVETLMPDAGVEA